MLDVPEDHRRVFALYEDVAMIVKKQIAGTLRLESAEEVRDTVLALTGSETQAEAAVYRWRADQLAAEDESQ